MKTVSEPASPEESVDFTEHYRAVLGNLPFPAWLKDTESRFLAVNEAFARTFGASDAESLVGKTDFDIAPRDLAEAYRADDRSVITSRQKRMIEEEIIDRGVRKWFETYKAPVLDQHGELLGTVGFAKDITERKQTEILQQESRQRLELALAGADLGMWDWDIPSGKVIFNERWASMLGETLEQLNSHVDTWINRVHPDDWSTVQNIWMAHQNGETAAYQSEHRIRHRSGKWVWVLDRGKVLERDANGQAIRAVGTHLDITERRESEQALRESEERFRLIFENSGEAIIFAWEDGRIQSANPAACRMFGYTEEDIRQLGRGGIIDTADPRLPKAIEERISTGKLRGEFRGIRSNGTTFPFEIVSTLFTDSKGEARTINQFRDITERKQAEQLQQDSRQRLEVALAGADLGMWDWHLPSGSITIDARWATMLGETPGHFTPDVSLWAERIHPDDQPVIQQAMAKLQQENTSSFETEYRLRHKNGHWVWILDRGKVVERNAAGQPVRVVGTHLDISQRKEAGQLLQEQLSHLQLRDNALSAISQGVLITGVDQLITYANAGFEMLTGYSPAEVLGGNCEFLLGPDTRPETRDEVLAALATGQPFHGEILVYRKDGTPFWNGLSVTPAFDDNGQLVQFVSVLRDITSRRQTEDELRLQAARIEAMSRRQIEAQEEMRRRLSADLHDRTSPNLAAISINLGILAGELAACGSAAMADRMEDTRALIEDTVASIREISAELRPPLLDYAGLIPAMESYAQQFSRRTGIKVRVERPAAHLSLDINRESILFRIFQEALTNGAKHSRATQINVSLNQDQHTISLSIADNGIGFDPAVLGAAPFGSGLGLINMKEITEFAGGTFAIDSQPGKGMHIHVQF